MELTNLINKSMDHLKLGIILYDIIFLMAKLPFSSLDHVNREKNATADYLARHALSMNSLYETYSSPPLWLVEHRYPSHY